MLFCISAPFRGVVARLCITWKARRVVHVGLVCEPFGIAKTSLDCLLELLLLYLFILLVYSLVVPVVVDEVLLPLADAVGDLFQRLVRVFWVRVIPRLLKMCKVIHH